jgi:hypothetical protein
LVLFGGGSGATITATCWVQNTTEPVVPGYTEVPVVKARVSVHPFNGGQAFPWPADSFIKYRKWTKTGEQGSGTPSDPTIELGYYDHLIDKLDMTSDQTKDANVIDYPRTSPVVEYGAGYKWKLGTSSLQWTAGFDIPRTYISEYRSYNIISGAVAQVTTQEEDDEIVAQDPSESNPNLTGWQLHHKQYFDIVPRTLETFTYDQPLIGSTFVGIKDVISYPTNLATDSPRVSVPCLGGLIRPSDALIANLTTYKDSVVYPGKGQHGGLEPHYPVWNPVSLNGATPAAVIFIGESLTLYHAGGEITSARNFNETTGKIEKGGPTGYKYTGTKPGYDLILIVDDYNKLPVTVPVIVIGASMLYAWTPAPWGGTYKDELVTGKNDLDSLPPFVLTLDRITHPSLNAITASNYTTETLTPTKFREFTNYFYTRDILCPDGSNPPRQTSNNFQDPGAPTAYKGDVGWAYASGNYTGQSSGLPPVNVLRHAEYQIDPDNYANNKYVTKRDIRLVTCSASLEVSTSSQKLTVLLSESYPVKILIYLRKWRELETNNYTTSSYKPTRFGAFCPLASEAVVKTSDTSYVLDLSSTTYDIPVGHDQGLLVQVRGVDLGESFTIVLPNAIVRTVMGMDIGGGSASLPSGVDNVPPATDGPVLKP